MEAAIDRIMQTYDLLANRSSAASAEARAKVTNYLNTLMEAGEKDTHRLTVCGLTYLRQLDGSVDPVKAGYTGLQRTAGHHRPAPPGIKVQIGPSWTRREWTVRTNAQVARIRQSPPYLA